MFARCSEFMRRSNLETICLFLSPQELNPFTSPVRLSAQGAKSVKAEVGRTFTERYQDTSTRPSGPALTPPITTYSSSLGSLLSGLKANFEGARADCDVLRGCRLISAYRRNKNLKYLLVHTKLKDNSLGANLGRALQPTTKNAVHAVRCRACHKLYVGETLHEISLRIKQHLYRINSGYGTSVLFLHFKLHGTENLQSLGLESSGSWITAQRRAAERRWIYCFKTIDPTGLNEKYQ
ncbi:hypothetical protein F7725_011906 [Dissostichus mawsoni]|uniref:GIY-YIG domain-containing protein n=1 Tax=Dissostichus mawsoni TaxID=36200 RepID=A0A7J5ZAA7_DISMA|nr:hypothetical protein F7725_011906 [Dissostichus mawsoni]